ncbi:MAG: hypothetical protein AAGG51_19660 [Cyanobacteria bacterium P01_G01_bin.54]
MVNKFVFDTNVLIVANGHDTDDDTHASLECRLMCLEFLMNCRELNIALDDLGLILLEYKPYMSFSGQPGVGDMFFKYLHDYQYASPKIHRVTITPLDTPPDDQERGFAELPPNQLDLSDRKLLATAVQAQATVVNATESDWLEQQTLLEQLAIALKQLCPEYATKKPK